MKEPSPRSSRLALAGGLVAAVAVGGASFVLGRRSVVIPSPTQVPSISATPVPVAASTSAEIDPLDRAGLIALAAQAADATARGEAAPPQRGMRSAPASRWLFRSGAPVPWQTATMLARAGVMIV